MRIDRVALFHLATSTMLERAVRAVPPAESVAWRAAARYVAGTTAEDAVRTVHELRQRGVAGSIDQFGEQVGDAAEAERVAEDYLRLAGESHAMADDAWLSVDLSHLGLDVDADYCADKLTAIARKLPPGRRIQVGAEDHDRADAVLGCVLATAGNGLADRVGATVQANLRRSDRDLDRLVEAGVHVRLVKGAYVEPAGRALPYGEPTDIAFTHLAHRLAEAGADFALATHDGVLREALLAALGPRPVEQLLGVRPDVVDDLVARGVPVRVYVPFGDNWFRYWMRRLAESRGS
ncbi:L-proline dehydrogenase [Amycolatopsis marina]|uniref:L-proline dehydrogenase n=1 Tax=Amycolatopsis marina TaxID=490629 RepID=A0A1I1C5J3_9PSEU|nr:proline dehydrogenase family protein [Amycolatopsis marina]SFB57935.1 L-proline dehydrogenase [Amycolatopsis marina]